MSTKKRDLPRSRRTKKTRWRVPDAAGSERPVPEKPGSRAWVWIALALFLVTLATFARVAGHDFVGFDDRLYLTQNPHVQSGLNADSLRWAFTTTHTGNWHPLTWLSHMLDWQLFGPRPGAHHLAGAFLHALNAALLFLALRRARAETWPSALVAALFALHPLHVESVAWASERKDLLSTLLWLLAMWAYAAYAEKPGARRYLLVLVLIALGLTAKPMLVTLPFVLLLLDVWPLDRLQRGARLIVEKLPFFALALVSAIVTFRVQQGGGAVSALDTISLPARLANAVVSYAAYLKRTLWPRDLAFFYPYPAETDLLGVSLSVLLVVAVTVLAALAIRRRPSFTVGWFWYLGTLVPVIGLVQVGRQASADRYTYVPLIGVFIVAAWGLELLVERGRLTRRQAVTVSAVVLAALAATTFTQLGYWRTSVSLYNRAIAVTEDNYVAHDLLGSALAQQGKLDQAIAAHLEALRIKPNFAAAHSNLGNALVLNGDPAGAVRHYREAVKVRPDNAETHYNLGIALYGLGARDEAEQHFAEAVRHKPDYADAHFNLGIVLRARGRGDEALRHFAEAVRLNPHDAAARRALEQARRELR